MYNKIFFLFKTDFKKLSKTKAKGKDSEGKAVLNTQNLVKRHGGILGLCAIAGSSPYEIPSYLPDIITYLCAFINDTAPIQVRIFVFSSFFFNDFFIFFFFLEYST
jgi:hypothetical protein